MQKRQNKQNIQPVTCHLLEKAKSGVKFSFWVHAKREKIRKDKCKHKSRSKKNKDLTECDTQEQRVLGHPVTWQSDFWLRQQSN